MHPGLWGKKPLSQRLPALKLRHLELFYGDTDWMDVRHGNAVAETCIAQSGSPRVGVHLISNSGHWIHLDNIPIFARILQEALKGRHCPKLAAVPEGFGDQFSGPNVPAYQRWEGYDFGR